MTSSAQTTKEYQDDLAVRDLIELATDGLVPMFDSEQGLFCFRLKQTEHGLVREGISLRYTIICLLGLHRFEASGGRAPINVCATLDKLLDQSDRITNAGDLGLLLWLCALVSSDHLSRASRILDLQSALRRYHDARQRRTMELAWFLSGLAHATLARGADIPELSELALRTYGLLKENQGENGLFGHLHTKSSFSGILRGRIGSFADQVYPIYALSKYSQAYDAPEAVKLALKCAEGISTAQGPLGQWWWHYDSVTGKVRGHYPVYSVHQHGMAPMALLALSEASRTDFTPQICKGLRWISGSNEIGFDFRSSHDKVIWRCLYSDSHGRTLEAVTSFFSQGHESARNLTVKFECWPYELGWLLYALAGTDLSNFTAN